MQTGHTSVLKKWHRTSENGFLPHDPPPLATQVEATTYDRGDVYGKEKRLNRFFGAIASAARTKLRESGILTSTATNARCPTATASIHPRANIGNLGTEFRKHFCHLRLLCCDGGLSTDDVTQHLGHRHNRWLSISSHDGYLTVLRAVENVNTCEGLGNTLRSVHQKDARSKNTSKQEIRTMKDGRMDVGIQKPPASIPAQTETG